MMLKGLQFVGIDDMGSDKVKKEKIAVSAEPVSGGGTSLACWVQCPL